MSEDRTDTFAVWRCRECNQISTHGAMPEHEHGELEKGYWLSLNPSTGSRPAMSVAEFRRLGYLQEINRRLLHPLGLALVVTNTPTEPEGFEWISGVFDLRDDPEGIYFGDLGPDDLARARQIDAAWDERRAAREGALGFMVEPLEESS